MLDLSPMITAPRSALLKGAIVEVPAPWKNRRFRNVCSLSSSNTWILGRWPKDAEQRLFLWWLRSSKSSFPWWRLGRFIYHRSVSHLESSNVDVSKFEPSKLDKPSTVAGVQGEVYQADLLGIGTVAVKISRRNDDYAKGDLVARSESFEGVWHWPHSCLTPIDWIQTFFFLMACKFSLVALLDDAIFLFLIDANQRWNRVGSPFPLTEMHAFQPRTCVPIAETKMVQLLDDSLKHAYSQHELSSMHTVLYVGNVCCVYIYNCTACLAKNVFVKYIYINGKRQIDFALHGKASPRESEGERKTYLQIQIEREIYIHF